MPMAHIGNNVYNFYQLQNNDHQNHYVRIRNSTNAIQAALCIDEMIVARPGAGVVLSNLVHEPVSPTASQTVSLSVDIGEREGATIREVIAYYRGGDFGGFTPIGMTNVSGNTFATTNPIPAGSGNLGGGGQHPGRHPPGHRHLR